MFIVLFWLSLTCQRTNYVTKPKLIDDYCYSYRVHLNDAFLKDKIK